MYAVNQAHVLYHQWLPLHVNCSQVWVLKQTYWVGLTDLMQCPHCHHLPPKPEMLRSEELFSYAGCTSMHFPVQIQKDWLLYPLGKIQNCKCSICSNTCIYPTIFGMSRPVSFCRHLISVRCLTWSHSLLHFWAPAVGGVAFWHSGVFLLAPLLPSLLTFLCLHMCLSGLLSHQLGLLLLYWNFTHKINKVTGYCHRWPTCIHACW